MQDPNDPAAAAWPERIGPYRVERRLGRGGMGEVFLAWDDRLERRVAVKRIRHDTELSPSQHERFLREARSAARLSHSAIVQVHDLVNEGSGDAIVMEYVSGATLAERLAAGPLRPAEALRLARQISEGLAAAHEAGVIHRDLKAENVIVTPAGQAKILDFGLARPVLPEAGAAELTQRGVLVGTFHAMSPEQAGGGAVDPRSDLFSFGALLYEMLTGRAPFRSANGLETLKRVLTETPPPLRAVRPDLPDELSTLLDRLLAKDREARPRTALEVSSILDRTEIRESVSLPDTAETVSDLPTGLMAVAPPLPQPLSRLPSAPPSTGGLSSRGPRRAWWAASLVVLAAVAVSSFFWYQRWYQPWPHLWSRRVPDRVLRVALLTPEVKAASGDPRLRLAASGVLSSALSSLASLEGLAPLEPRETGPGQDRPLVVARANAADEVIAATLEPEEGTLARVSLRRIQGSDGRVLWSETFQVPIDPASLRLLADAVTVRLRHAYPGRRLRPGTPDLDVRDEDYAAFLAVKQQIIDNGDADLAPPLARLEEIVRRSPRFLDAQILAARTAMSLYLLNDDPSLLDRAASLTRQAKDLSPNDPRPLGPEFQVALAAGREKDAEAVLARMEEVQPGDPEVLLQRSRLAQQQGRWDEALRSLRTAVERTPSWKYFYYLALLETQVGQVDLARQHYGMALSRAPGNTWSLIGLAHLELAYGDLEEAERLYTEITLSTPRADLFLNLGTAYLLQGRYAEARSTFRKVLEIDPSHTSAFLNLADTEIELGRENEAGALYQKALDRMESRRKAGSLSAGEAMDAAVCLARLGRSREAATHVRETLRSNPDDPDLLYGAALVYSLIGDRNSALSNAQAALDKGKSPRWFTGSAFRPLLKSGELQALLIAAPGNKPLPSLGGRSSVDRR